MGASWRPAGACNESADSNVSDIDIVAVSLSEAAVVREIGKEIAEQPLDLQILV